MFVYCFINGWMVAQKRLSFKKRQYFRCGKMIFMRSFANHVHIPCLLWQLISLMKRNCCVTTSERIPHICGVNVHHTHTWARLGFMIIIAIFQLSSGMGQAYWPQWHLDELYQVCTISSGLSKIIPSEMVRILHKE